MKYDDSLILKDALQIYFSRHHFPNGGYEKKFFNIKIGKLKIPFPNTEGRKKAVKFHDIHHVLTEYDADWPGEVEIGGWEIGSGCGKHYIAWFLNFGSFTWGVFSYPQKLFKAFMHGRNTKTNFYYDTIYNDQLLNSRIGELRKKLHFQFDRRNTLIDYVYFFSICILGIATYLISILLIYKLWLVIF